MPKRDDINAYSRAYYHANRERISEQVRARKARMTEEQKNARRAYDRLRYKNGRRQEKHKASVIKYRYGITAEQFEELMQTHGNRCAVCKEPFKRKNEPCIDHCHKTNIVRGLLCSTCNAAEGYLGSVEKARRLYEYMLKNELFYQGVS